MKQTTQGTIGYVGTVNVSLKHGNTVYYNYSSHNEGTPAFFRGLCCLLAKQAYVQVANNLPSTLMLQNATGTNLLADAIPTDTNIEAKETSIDSIITYLTVLHFNVPGLQIIKEKGAISKLILCGQDGSTTLATFVLKEPINSDTFTSNSQLIIEWAIGFTNVLDSNTDIE